MDREDATPPWPGSPHLSALQAAQCRLALAQVFVHGTDALALDVVETVGRLVRGVGPGLSGVLAAAHVELYKSVFVSEMRAERIREAPANPLDDPLRSPRTYMTRACAHGYITRDHRPYGALGKGEQVQRLRALMSHRESRRHLAHMCCNAGMDEDKFRGILRVLCIAT